MQLAVAAAEAAHLPEELAVGEAAAGDAMRPSRLCHVEQVARDGDASRGSQSLEAIRAATLNVQQDHTLVEAINDTHAAVRQCSDVPRP